MLTLVHEEIIMTYTQLVQAISQILPECSFDEDLEGQIVIYTNLSQTSPDDNDSLQTFESQ